MVAYRQTLAVSLALKFLGKLILRAAAQYASSHGVTLTPQQTCLLTDLSTSYLNAGTVLTSGAQEFYYDPLGGGLVHSAAVPDPNGRATFISPDSTSAARPPVGDPIPHQSALPQCTGEALYVDDIPAPPGTLHGAFVLSDRPSGRILSIDAADAHSFGGGGIVKAVFTSRDVAPDGNHMGPVLMDEELFRSHWVTAVGQPIALVVATSAEEAQKAAKRVRVMYASAEETAKQAAALGAASPDTHLHPPAFTIDASVNQGRWKKPTLTMVDGDLDAGFAAADVVVTGDVRIGGQEHFYLETMAALAIPGEEMHLHVSSQETMKAQKFAAKVCGLPIHRVVSHVKRVGGGFGGKETRAVFVSSAVALAAHKLRVPVRLSLDRDVDMMITGARHPFIGKYKVGAKKNGKIVAADVEIFNNAGYSLDLSEPVLGRSVLHIDNAYKIPNLRVEGKLCYTNTVTNTAFRGFGGPQGMMITETFMDHLATELRMDPDRLREVNLYREGERTHYGQLLERDTLHRLWSEINIKADVGTRREAVAKFNAIHTFKKRGLAVIPTKFGINFTAKFMNQGGALVHIYVDGTVLVSHGGTEMGQGLHTKCAQVAARALGISIGKVHIAESASDKVPNAIPTAASSGSDIYGLAILDACEKLKARLDPYVARVRAQPVATTLTHDDIFKKAVEIAFFDRVNLSAQGWFAMPTCGFDFSIPVPKGTCNSVRGTPFNYFTCGAACSEVEVDVLTGDLRVLRTDIVMDLGNSLNPAIDIGQIEGAFVQGMGWCMLEETMWGSPDQLAWLKPGACHSRGPGVYKLPSFNDVPIDFRVSLLGGAPNPKAIHSSKAVGEPPLFLGSSVFFAAKDAIAAARKDPMLRSGKDVGSAGAFVAVNSPLTPERIRMACDDVVATHFTKRLVEAGGPAVPALFC